MFIWNVVSCHILDGLAFFLKLEVLHGRAVTAKRHLRVQEEERNAIERPGETTRDDAAQHPRGSVTSNHVLGHDALFGAFISLFPAFAQAYVNGFC